MHRNTEARDESKNTIGKWLKKGGKKYMRRTINRQDTAVGIWFLTVIFVQLYSKFESFNSKMLEKIILKKKEGTQNTLLYLLSLFL